MKTTYKYLSLVLVALLIALLLAGCWNLNLSRFGVKSIKPSNVIITEERDVSGFSAIDFSTFGKMIIAQGDSESLTIKGSDNIVPLVQTSVSNGVLIIKMEKKVSIVGLTPENVLTFTISVKDLTSLDVSGAGDFEMDSLDTTDLAIDMSGAGRIAFNDLTAESLTLDLSGAGGVELAGEVTKATIDLSGAGGVDAPDLKIQTAEVNISGLGGATIWVTDQLTGEISGAGGVSYYGNPQTDTSVSGLGNFKNLGEK